VQGGEWNLFQLRKIEVGETGAISRKGWKHHKGERRGERKIEVKVIFRDTEGYSGVVKKGQITFLKT